MYIIFKNTFLEIIIVSIIKSLKKKDINKDIKSII